MDELREKIREVGGLHTQADLARRWSVSPAAVSESVKYNDFPAPVVMINDKQQALYSGVEADAWRAKPRRRPGPKPRSAVGKA